MAAYILWTVFTWTVQGILCTCRFLWICPYNAVKFLPREQHVAEDTSRQLKQLVVYECRDCSRQGTAAVPGSPDRLTKAEKEILSLKTRIACERASWERRFAELKRKQEEIHNQLTSQAGVVIKAGDCEDNGEEFDECSSSLSRAVDHHRHEVPSRCDTSMGSWRTFRRPHRVFVPHSPMDLELGHRVRIMLPSGRISTGTIRFLGHLQGEAEFHLGVELRTPDQGLQSGSHRGHSYFQCKPGYGAFVPFHRLLMAWE